MWQPANRAALPSLEDFKHAKRAISELEVALKDALVALEQAQLRVRALTKDLDERKAWIAPIRKLPNELLSEIFIFGSEIEHLGPVRITEVCRLWRTVVLATRRAWSLIYTNAPERQNHLVQYVSTFVERSNPCLLHLWIPVDGFDDDEDSDFDYSAPENRILPLFLSALSRIRCLSIESRHLMSLKEESMPSLTRLWITDLAEDILPFFINQSQFPRLQSLLSTGCSWGDSLSFTSFPPLQHLGIQVNNHSTWLEVVKNCSTTLKSLRLLGCLQWTERVTITFPRLESLSFREWPSIREASEWSNREWISTQEAREWSIRMVTPALISYTEFSGASLRHGDVKSVIYLRSDHVPDLAPYTSLRVLFLSPLYTSMHGLCASKLVEQLTPDINTCPALQLVEFDISSIFSEEESRFEARRGIIEQIRAARPCVEVVFATEVMPMPGSMQESSCEPGMPCLEDQGDVVED